MSLSAICAIVLVLLNFNSSLGHAFPNEHVVLFYLQSWAGLSHATCGVLAVSCLNSIPALLSFRYRVLVSFFSRLFLHLWVSLRHDEWKSNPCWIVLPRWKILHCIRNLNFHLLASPTWVQKINRILWLHFTLLSFQKKMTNQRTSDENKEKSSSEVNQSESSPVVSNFQGSSIYVFNSGVLGDKRLLNVSNKI